MDQATASKNLILLEKSQDCKSRYRTTSAILSEIAHEKQPSLSIRELSDQLGDRGFGLILLLLALPNTIPLPIPGVSTLTSIPMMFFAAQLCLGRQKLWLPEWMGKREISMATFQPFIHKALPWLLRLEKFVKPRLDAITSRTFEQIAGVLIMVMACLLILPIPLGNLPPGLAITILALAITEQDGVLMITGWLFTFFALVYMGFLIAGYAWVLWQAFSTILPTYTN